MSIQPTLFNSMPPQPPNPLKCRERAMEAAAEKAGKAFQEAYETYVLLFLSNGPATAETIRLSYEKTPLPKPPSKRASGAVFAKLRRAKKVREVGREISKIYGNSLPILELVKDAQT